MKKYRTKPWAKGLACGLFVLAMTVSVICLGNVRWLAYHGGYQWEGTRQLVEEEEAVWVENLTNQLADGYRSYRDGDQSLDVKRYVEDENFFFTIKDLEGNTLLASDTLGDYREKTSWSMQVGGTVQWSHIDQYYDSYEARDLALDQLGSTYEELQNVSLVEDEEGYRLTADVARTVGKETVVLTGFLRSELSPTGQVYQGIQYAENMGFYRYEFLAGAILGLVLGLLSLGFLLWSAGLRQEGSEEVSLRWMDRAIPTDLLIAAGAAVLLFGLLPVVCSSGWGTSLVAFGPTVLTMVLMGVVLAMALSLVRRRRGGIGRENLFFPRLIRPVRRWGKALGRRTGELLGKLPLFWAAGLGFLLLCFLEGLCPMGCYYGGGWVVLWLLLKVLEGGLVLFVVLSMRTLQAGGRQLAAGHLDYKVSTEHLRGPFREHGENLNNIRQGIQHAVEEQMKSERMKTELITNVSHDIKTPLTSIVSYVDLLKKQAMPNDQAREYLEVLDRQSARLKKLTEDLVEASKASTGNLTVDFQRTDVNVLLTQSAGEYQEKLAAKGMDLILTPAPENPAISADGRLLWRVFENLLSNIHKYAQPGTRVYLTCEAGENQVTITFRNISATPLNISADELMERFVRGDASRNTEGSGLGLSIARSLTQLQARDLLPDHRRGPVQGGPHLPPHPLNKYGKSSCSRENRRGWKQPRRFDLPGAALWPRGQKPWEREKTFLCFALTGAGITGYTERTSRGPAAGRPFLSGSSGKVSPTPGYPLGMRPWERGGFCGLEKTAAYFVGRLGSGPWSGGVRVVCLFAGRAGPAGRTNGGGSAAQGISGPDL